MSTTALVLLDIQRGILASDAIKFENPETPKALLAAAGAMLKAARAAGILVVHVGVARPPARGTFDESRTAMAKKSGKVPRDMLGLAAGSSEVEFLLDVAAQEERVYKVGVSAFEGTRLDQLLRNGGIREVVIGGAFTHMVVESTARQGFDLGYRMVVAQDACCAPMPAPHNNSLATGIPNFAVVTDSTAVVAALGKGTAVGA